METAFVKSHYWSLPRDFTSILLLLFLHLKKLNIFCEDLNDTKLWTDEVWQARIMAITMLNFISPLISHVIFQANQMLAQTKAI